MILQKKLSPPKDIRDTEERESSRAEVFIESKNLDIPEDTLQKISQDVGKKYEDWKKNTSKLRKRLARYNNILEGIVEETNFPFEGASNITLHYAAIVARAFRSVFNKAMFKDDDIAVPVLSPGTDIEPGTFIALRQGFNHLLSKSYNIVESLKNGVIPVARDGTMVISASWERNVEKAFDFRIYRTPKQFNDDYPQGSISELDREAVMRHFISDPDNNVRIDFEMDFVSFDGLKAALVPLANFVKYPVFVKDIKDCQLYGSIYHLPIEDLKLKKSQGRIYESSADKVLASGSALALDSYQRSINQAQGIGAGDKNILLADLVLKYDLDNDGIPEKYFLTYAPDYKTILSFQRYQVRRNIDMSVGFRIVDRENQFYGNSLIGDSEDLFNQMDTMVRHQNNVFYLTTSPVILAKQSIKDSLDLGAAQSVVRPGLTLWVDDINNSMRQLPLQDLGIQDFVQNMSFLSKLVEMLWGPQNMRGAMPTQEDLRQPAAKTYMQATQSNQRVDDLMDCFRSSMADLFNLCAALIYQYYGDQDIKLNINDQEVKFPSALLADPRIKWEAKRKSVDLTPEFSIARVQSLLQAYGMIKPLIIQGDRIAIQIWNRIVENSGEPESQKFIINEENAEQIKATFEAMKDALIKKGIDYKALLKGESAYRAQIGKDMAEIQMKQAALSSLSQEVNPASLVPSDGMNAG